MEYNTVTTKKKNSYNNNKLRIFVPTWNDKFEFL